MLDKTLPAVVDRLASTDSSLLLDRVGFQSEVSLTKTQAFVDGIVSHSLEEVARPSLMSALLGANFASRLTRIGFMSAASSLLTEGSTILPTFARGGSYAIALANESAVFAGIEKGFARLQGHPSSQPFQKDWARAAINLGSLKFFGKLAEGENLLLRHVMTDFGMVMGQHGGAALGITQRPEGSFAQQMVEAEAMNLSMEGSLALLHGLSPSLHATERSLDFYLKSRQPLLSSGGRFSPGLVLEGGPEDFLTDSWEAEEMKESYIWKAKKDETSKDLGEYPEPPRLLDGGTAFERKLLRSTEGDGLSDEALERIAVRLGRTPSIQPATRRFVETALDTPDPYMRRSVIKVLATLDDPAIRNDLLVMVLNSSRPDVRRSAVEALAELGDLIELSPEVHEAVAREARSSLKKGL